MDERAVAGIGTLPAVGSSPTAAMPVWSTFIRVESAAESVKRAVTAGGRLLLGPLDGGPAGCWAALLDPSGASFGVWEAGERTGAQLVNEPCTWAMSALHTPDPATTEPGPDGPSVPPHWNVNLQVDDSDEAAARAVELGGRILLAPMDTPGFRSAVLMDPQGAAFSISHVVGAALP